MTPNRLQAYMLISSGTLPRGLVEEAYLAHKREGRGDLCSFLVASQRLAPEVAASIRSQTAAPQDPVIRQKRRRHNAAETLRQVLSQDPLFSPHADLVFDTLEVLGQGGMGTVYRVKDLRLGREAAFKVLNDDAEPDALLRFQREAEITARLDHPGIPPVYEAGTTLAGQRYLLMKVIEGRTLQEDIAEYHKSGRPVEELRRLLEVLVKVCETLDYAHAKGVVHRDLKPSNIMIGGFGEVYVMDWGLAYVQGEDLTGLHSLSRLSLEDAKEMGLTQSGAILGTPGYMAPEQALGGVVSRRTDVFALGAILCKLLTDRLPVDGDTDLGLIKNLVRGTIFSPRQRNPKADPVLSELAARCLSRELDQRPARAEFLRAELALRIQGPRRRLGPWIAALTFGVLALLALTLTTRPPQAQSARPSNALLRLLAQAQEREDAWDFEAAQAILQGPTTRALPALALVRHRLELKRRGRVLERTALLDPLLSGEERESDAFTRGYLELLNLKDEGASEARLREACERLLETRPDDTELCLALAELSRSDPQLAEEWLNKAESFGPKDPRLLLFHAQQALRSGRVDAALKRFDSMSQRRKLGYLTAARALLLFLLGEGSQALQEIQYRTEQPSDPPAVRGLHALAKAQRARLAGSAKPALAGPQLGPPPRPLALAIWARCFIENGETNRALETLALFTRSPDSGLGDRWAVYRSWFIIAARDPAGARQALACAEQLAGKPGAAGRETGFLLELSRACVEDRLGRFEAAEDADTEHRNHAAAFRMLARITESPLEELEAVRAELTELEGLAPWMAHPAAPALAEQLSQLERLRAIARGAPAISPEERQRVREAISPYSQQALSPQRRLDLALLCERNGLYSLGLSLLDGFENNALLLYLRHVFQLKRDKQFFARSAELERFLLLKPSEETKALGLYFQASADLIEAQENPQERAQVLEEVRVKLLNASAFAPGLHEPRVLLAVVNQYRSRGTRRPIWDFNMLVDRDPADPRLPLTLANLHLVTGRYPQAITEAQRARQLGAKSADEVLALAHYLLGRPLRALEIADGISSDANPEIRSLKALSKARTKNLKTAETMARSALAQLSSGLTLTALARILCRSGQAKEACALFFRSLRSFKGESLQDWLLIELWVGWAYQLQTEAQEALSSSEAATPRRPLLAAILNAARSGAPMPEPPDGLEPRLLEDWIGAQILIAIERRDSRSLAEVQTRLFELRKNHPALIRGDAALRGP